MTTVTVDDFKRLIHPLETHPLLTPKEANNLTYQIIELLMDKPCTSQLLQLLARFLTPQAYDALVEERIINHHCGYPLCPYSSSSIHDGEVNTVAKRLNMRAYYKTRYCSKRHYQCSEVFKRQLNSDALFMRVDLDREWFTEGSIENGIVLLEEEEGVVKSLNGLTID